MATVMKFRMPAAKFPLGSVFEDLPKVSVELERIIPHDTLIIPYFWVRGVDTDDIEAAFHLQPGVKDIILVDEVENEYLMRADWDRDHVGVMNAMSGSNIVVLSGVGTDTGWEFEVRCESQSDINDFRDYCQEHDIPIEVSAIHALVPMHADSILGMTDTQREALILAYERGYYETPREVTLQTIADELGITQQSLASRLRRGYRRLIAGTLIGS